MLRTMTGSTRHLAGVTLLSLLSLTVTVKCTSLPGRYEVVYPLGFFDISVKQLKTNQSKGVVAMFACSANKEADMLLAFVDASFNKYAKVGRSNFEVFYDCNGSPTLIGDRTPGGSVNLPLGIDISADHQISVYGVQSDGGSIDGFLVPPLTDSFTEFYIAGWKGDGDDAGILISAAFPDTCIEIYRITDGTNYNRIYNIYLPDDKYMSEIGFYNGDDPTGLYVNSSKPISVFSSVACGFVPIPNGQNRTKFCDYMAEQLLPVTELGNLHIVPFINGRDPYQGYIVRVVATALNTTVNWMSVPEAVITVTDRNGVNISGVMETVITRSEFLQFDLSSTSRSAYTPLLVNCSHKCIVMQYNKGKSAPPVPPNEDVYSDPFMMLTVPVDHFVNTTCFRTAKGADDSSNANTDINMVHYVSIVTRANEIALILLDGSSVVEKATLSDIDGFTVASVRILDGWHSITGVGGTKFAAYVYGHAAVSSTKSSLGYGYPVAYRVFQDPTPAYRPQENSGVTNESTVDVDSCRKTHVTTGAAVVGNSDGVVNTPIQLTTNVTVNNSEPLTDRCRNNYTAALQQLLLSASKDVNAKLCTQDLCAYVYNTSETGVLISPSNATSTYVFVAIDVTQVSNSVKFVTSSDNVVTSVRVDVPFYGIYNTTLESYENCRMDVRSHLSSLVNWLTPGNGLTEQHPIVTPPGCPELTFHPNMTIVTDIVCDVWTGTP